VFSNVKSVSVRIALICFAVGSMTSSASAVSVELAKKCSALMTKAYPPRLPGNPAAGSAKGSGAEARTYYQKCLANNGKVDDNAGTQGNNATPPGSSPNPKPK
jgi:hypothetical protein